MRRNSFHESRTKKRQAHCKQRVWFWLALKIIAKIIAVAHFSFELPFFFFFFFFWLLLFCSPLVALAAATTVLIHKKQEQGLQLFSGGGGGRGQVYLMAAGCLEG